MCFRFPSGVRRIPYKAEWKHVRIGDVSWHEGRSEGQDPEEETTSDLARAALSLAIWGEFMPGFRALLLLVFPPALSRALA